MDPAFVAEHAAASSASLALPATSNFDAGLAVPTPTLPVELTRKASTPETARPIVPATEENNPVVTSSLRLGFVAAVAVPKKLLPIDTHVGEEP